MGLGCAVRAMGIVYIESQGQTFNQKVYKDILRRLLSSVREERRELWLYIS